MRLLSALFFVLGIVDAILCGALIGVGEYKQALLLGVLSALLLFRGRE